MAAPHEFFDHPRIAEIETIAVSLNATGESIFSSDRGDSMNVWRVPIYENSGQVLGPLEPVSTPSQYVGHTGHTLANLPPLFLGRRALMR